MTPAAVLEHGDAPAPAALEASVRRARRTWAPPSDVRCSEFANAEVIVTTGPFAGTRLQTDFAPYQVGILDAFHEPGVQTVIVKGSSQWGKTLCAQVLVAYHAKHDPCPILVVEPTLDPMAEDFSKNRLEPMIDASPALREIFAKKRTRDASNTVLLKTFRGGFVAIGGANSAASLAARSIRFLILDEIDRYPQELEGEGSTIAIAIKRTTTYGRRKRILMTSSPTLVGVGIDARHKQGDQRRYYVPCPGCGHRHAYEWKNVKWVGDEPSTARLHCPACDYAIDEAERVAILARGEWRAEHPGRVDKTIVSFHIWEAYSPLSTLEEIVKGFLAARAAQKAGDKAPMHTWENTTLGEAHEPDPGEGAEAHALLVRREAFGEAEMLPDMCVVTMGLDTQDNRLEALVVAWGAGEECCLIDRVLIPGDTSQPDAWEMAGALLEKDYAHPSGVRLSIAATCIDAGGHRTTEVYRYAAKHAARRVFAIIGRDGPRPIVSSPSERTWGRNPRPVPLFTIGVDASKALLVGRLALTKTAVVVGEGAAARTIYPGYVHIPHADWADDELAAQLTSERLVKRFSKGRTVSEWVKVRERNEMLDCFVYAHAAMRLVNPQFDVLRARLLAPGTPPPPPAPPAGGGWLGRRQSGWLKGGRR